jgi:hypothetical protein
MTVSDYASSLENEKVRVDNFIRFSSIYTEVHTIVMGHEPFNTRIRRAFNRHNKAAAIDGIKSFDAPDLAHTLADELSA